MASSKLNTFLSYEWVYIDKIVNSYIREMILHFFRRTDNKSLHSNQNGGAAILTNKSNLQIHRHVRLLIDHFQAPFGSTFFFTQRYFR